MVAISLGFGALIGVPLGIVLVVCRPGGIVANPVVHQALNPLINVLRSLPFIILLIVILPFTSCWWARLSAPRGHRAADRFVAPYIARLVESSLLEVDEGILRPQTPWAQPSADRLALYAAGGGGVADSGPYHRDHRSAWRDRHGGNGGRRRIGDLAITYGYQRFDAFATPHHRPGVLIVIVQLIQTLGTRLARRLRRE